MIFVWSLIALAFFSGWSGAAAQSRPQPTATDYGGVGLIQMRNARFNDDGDLWVGYFQGFPWKRFLINLQALPWLELTARYGDLDWGGEVNRDRSVDAKLLIFPESDYIPQIALGFQDILGTGLYSGEYLVASKRYFDFDFSLGVGWGRIGSYGDFDNPLSWLFRRFETRDSDFGQGGLPSFSWFHGKDMSLFGGVEYHTDIDGLNLKLEINGDSMVLERSNSNFRLDSRINIGANYRFSDWAQLGASFENGNTFMLRGLVGLNIGRKATPVVIDSPPPRVAMRQNPSPGGANVLRPTGAKAGGANVEAAARLIAQLREQGLQPVAAQVDGVDATAIMARHKYRELPKIIGRTSRVMANALPDGVERFTVVVRDAGTEIARVSLYRGDIERGANDVGSQEETWMRTTLASPLGTMPAGTVDAGYYPRFSWGIEPKLRQQFMDPSEAFRYEVWAALSGTVEWLPGLRLTGTIGQSLFGNLDQIRTPPASELPHVRSDIAKYLQEGTTGIERLQGDYLWNVAPDWYARISAGLFEPMFGGVGGELLYRPQGRRWALGFDVNHVWQRGYNQQFDFLGYEVTTGHASAYYSFPFYGLHGAVHAGRYLAGDWGATFELARRFSTGLEIGAFATFTTVPFEEFGEGSFDKGIFVNIPLDMFVPFPTTSVGSVVLHSLARDGGQRLGIGNRLYPITEPGDGQRIKDSWNRLFE